MSHWWGIQTTQAKKAQRDANSESRGKRGPGINENIHIFWGCTKGSEASEERPTSVRKRAVFSLSNARGGRVERKAG